MSIILSTKIKIPIICAALLFFIGIIPTNASAATSQYVFPVTGSSSYSNDFTAPRSNGQHNAIDIIANKGQQIVSATDGTIVYVAYPQPSWGFMVSVRSDSNYTYDYIHMNNDNPGTDDGRGGAMHAYAPDVEQGRRVSRGQLLGWVGDSGNSEDTVPHLHFEVRNANGDTYNPYYKLQSAQRIGHPLGYPEANDELLPFGGSSKMTPNLAYDDMNGDGTDDVIVGAGYGQKPWVKIFSGVDNTKLLDFYPMSGKGNRGADVATGDIDGDGQSELIVGSRTFYGGKVAAYKYIQGNATLVSKYTVYGGAVTDVRVAAGDIDGDGNDDIIAGAGPGGGPRIKVIDVATGDEKQSFYPFSSKFRGGVDVGSGNLAGDIKDEIASAPFAYGSSYIRVHDANAIKLREFRSYESTYSNGLRLSVANIEQGSTYEEVATMPNNHLAMVKYFNATGSRRYLDYPYEQWWEGRFDIAAAEGDVRVAAGNNRRTSVRE